MTVVDENEFFRQATLQISSSLDIKTAMKQLMSYLKGYMPVSGMFFGLYDPDLNLGRILASIWSPHIPKPSGTISFPQALWGWMRKEWAKKAGVRIINDVIEEDQPIRQTFAMIWPEETSHLIIDLELESRRLGALQLFVEGKNRYDKTHADLIALLHDPFAIAFSNILQHQEILRLKDMLADDNNYLRRQMVKITGDTIIGADFGLRGVMEMVYQVAPLDSPVLLMGETGVGKELVANAVHFSSSRKNNPYIRVNCGAIPENLVDSELFGHEKGAFTGAISKKRGRFERAHTGTIFLDEVGELPLAAQVRLLRVLQQHEIERVGGTEVIPVDVRIISATHQNLEEMVRNGKFREDLWFRLNVFPIIIPPLRQRKDDIPALVSHFIERKSRELKMGNLPSVAQAEMERLQSFSWPGNVRELENIVERAMIQSQVAGKRDTLQFHGLSAVDRAEEINTPRHPDVAIGHLDNMIAVYIKRALVQTGGKVEGKDGAARMLGLNPSTLRGRMKKLGIPYGRLSRNNFR
jgi:transcriptional regulator with GAF, ATPase, and Fis domain